MTQDISKALEAVRGGTSPVVASMLHGVSVEEIEVAMLARDAAKMPPGYASPASKAQIRRKPQDTRPKPKPKPKPKGGRAYVKKVRPAYVPAVSAETANTAALVAKELGLHRQGVHHRAMSDDWPGWRRRPATDEDRERLGHKRIKGLYWVTPGARTSLFRAQMTERVEAYLALHGETKWLDLSKALHMTSGEQMARLRRTMHYLVSVGWVSAKTLHGLTYYTPEETR